MKNKIPDIDISRLVILGGTFEEIGGKDEAIGGGNQKVGSDIQVFLMLSYVIIVLYTSFLFCVIYSHTMILT